MKRSPDLTWRERPGGRRPALAGRLFAAPCTRRRSPKRTRKAWAACLPAIGFLLAAGCEPGRDLPAEVVRPNILEEPCAVRMGNICETLLLYYAAQGRLPATRADLAAARGPDAPPLVCPGSQKPYVYDPAGLTIPRLPGRLILYDPEPSHVGMRLAILLEPPADGTVPVARPVAVSESEFDAARKGQDGSQER